MTLALDTQLDLDRAWYLPFSNNYNNDNNDNNDNNNDNDEDAHTGVAE
jgi:hypothetical protein